MREPLQRRWFLAIYGLLACFGLSAHGQQPMSAEEATRLEQISRMLLPTAQAALKSHLRRCDIQLAVLQARQSIAATEESGDSGLWQDMEVLTVQCQTTTQRLRAEIEELQQEQKKLQQSATAKPPAQ